MQRRRASGFARCAFIDHGGSGTGEAAALVLRRGNAGSNTAEDHIIAARLALAQIPVRSHKQVLIRTDSGGGTREFLNWCPRLGVSALDVSRCRSVRVQP